MKENPKHIRISEYNYPLPDERIAKFPLPVRDQSKLLIYRHGEVSEDVFTSLPEYLPAGSLMIFNNTKVIQARLHFRKETGALIEVFCLEPIQPNDYVLNFQQTEHAAWLCMVGNLKKWKDGPLCREMTVKGFPITLTATRGECRGTSHWIDFRWDNPEVTFADILEVFGELPIPPYLNRDTEESDKETYQTVYSKIKGSVAAPTAGLHFTPRVLDALTEKGIDLEELTLHVGAGTFKPVKSEDYFFDTYEFTRWFSDRLLWNTVPGDVTTVPDVPSIVKSRPICGDNANSVLLNLDKVRHFIFLRDDIPFRKKSDKAIFRLAITRRPHRERFMRMYFGSECCDAGISTPRPEYPPEWTKPHISMYDHLNYKFILAIEGYDVATNLKWIMSSNSLAVMPRPTYETWFMEGTLIPGYHYVEIRPDYSDLEERMRYYIEHPDEAEAIIAHAHEYVAQFRDRRREKIISLLVLQNYFRRTGQR